MRSVFRPPRSVDAAGAFRDEPLAEPISDILRRIPVGRYGMHPVQDYISAFEGSTMRAQRFLCSGHESFVLQKAPDTVMKITWFELRDEFGSRPFDAPILERGTIELGRKGLFVRRVNFFVQPRVAMEATGSDVEEFGYAVAGLGYEFVDKAEHQIGRYEGGIVLVDPYAVRKKTERPLYAREEVEKIEER
ncbi:MAG: hypothetical protein U0R44_02240 [Candidatus Micrarchaeia archaeon]